jgi:hypothetical protein
VNKSSSLFLFHHPKFVFRNQEHAIVPFESDSIVIYFSKVADALISLDRAPFGGFIADHEVPKNDLLPLLKNILEWSNSKRITNIIIRSFPDPYAPQFSKLIKEALLECGFKIMYSDVAQVLHVDNDEMKLNTHKKRRLRNAVAAGFTFQEIPVTHLDACYSLIVRSRESKGYPVTMTLQELKNIFALFPEEYLLFGVFDKDKLIAASVCIEVNNKIMYCFYIGDDLDYRAYSPVTLLIHGIYRHCRQNGYKLLDLGISTDKGILNKGLYTFKKTFGAVDSQKLTYLREL